jgi:hypothetical protein
MFLTRAKLRVSLIVFCWCPLWSLRLLTFCFYRRTAWIRYQKKVYTLVSDHIFIVNNYSVNEIVCPNRTWTGQYLKWQWIFYFLRICFLFSITANTLTVLVCTYELHGGCLVRSRQGLPIWVQPWFFGGECVSQYLFLLCFIDPCFAYIFWSLVIVLSVLSFYVFWLVPWVSLNSWPMLSSKTIIC